MLLMLALSLVSLFPADTAYRLLLPSCLVVPQVATDTRLYLFKQLQVIRGDLQELIRVACSRAEAEADVLMPGQDEGPSS
jgi:hypothetical protein